MEAAVDWDWPPAWRALLAEELEQPYLAELAAFVAAERRTGVVFPPADQTLRALSLTSPARVRVVVLGQDPYHDEGQAEGLAFSAPRGEPIPPSLRNIYRELRDDLGIPPAPHGHLGRWAEQGVLLLNAVLTVRAHAAGSHRGRGWERLTDAVLARLAAERDGLVFLLWGAYARQKASLLDPGRHLVLESAHPSPLSARRGFFGSRPFSRINAWFRARGEAELDWRLDDG